MSQAMSAEADALLTAEQVARLLGVTPGWVYAHSRSGLIPTVTLGRYRRCRREPIETWIRELERTGTVANDRRRSSGR